MPPPPPASPAPGARRRGGRPAGRSPSRQKILDVARRAFPANGYTETSLRGIARDAGVDPSLVVQQFGSKAGLFAAVIEWPFDASTIADEIREVPAGAVGDYAARQFIDRWDRDEHRDPLISLILAGLSDPAAATLFREFITTNLTLPIVERTGADRPQLRAAILASQLIGFGLSRHLLGFDALASTPSDALTRALGATLQQTCTGTLGDPVDAERQG